MAGDVRHGSIKRVASAVGDGAMAVQLIHQYLSKPDSIGGAEASRPLAAQNILALLSGIFDHLLLIRTFGPARALGGRNGDVAA